MRKSWIPKKVLSVIMAAALAMSPTVTAVASPVEEQVDETVVSETTNDKADDTQSEAESEAEEATEDLPVFEKVDPKEEGLEDLTEVLNGEDVETPNEEVDPNEQTRVIIVMEGDSVLDKGYDTEDLAENKSAMRAADKIEAAQEKQVEKISNEALDGEELDVNFNFSILTNAISADVAFKDIEAIEKVDGVEAVYVASQYEPCVEAEPNTITSGDMVGSYETWATGYTGAGTRIAVIDTGIDIDHPSFDADAFDAHLEETAEAASKSVSDYNLLNADEIENVLPNLNATKQYEGLTADELFNNDKVPFAFNYVDKNLDITHDNDEQGDHGTHVSGIATANYYVKNAASATGFARETAGVVGIAPDAQLISMKVFGTNGGAYTDDYMAAIEDALLLKADAINLSLGSSAAGNSSDEEEYVNEIFKKLEGTSTVVSISAGNAGRWSDSSTYGVNLSKDVNLDTVGSPGSYTNAFTVASAVNSGMTANNFTLSDGKNIFYTDANDTLAPQFLTLDVSEDKSGTEYPFVFLNAKGEPADYEGVDVKDKIVFVYRGAITFGQKQMNAEAAGAKAIVIVNNQPGTITMTMQGSTAVIPAVSIKQSEGEAVAATGKEVAEGVYEGTIKINTAVATDRDVPGGYTMSDFSSYGVPGSLDLKPEITGPGGNIYSTRDNGTYGQMSGTSMSAPSLAGQSALVEQYIKENDLAEKNDISVRTLAQSLIMSTASPLYEDNDKTGLEYSPRSQGAGLANVQDAISSPAYILVGDKEGNDGKVKAVLGDDPTKSGKYEFSFDVYNMDEDPQYYVLDSTVLTEELYDSEGTTYFAGSSHKLNPEVTLTADDTKLVYDLNDDGKVNNKDRKILLQVVNGSRDVAIVDKNADYYDFNNDGLVDTKDVYALSKQLKGGEAVADLALEVVEVKDSTKVNVAINLSDSDREYLAGFENGMYVDGFVYVKGGVDLSVPFLAFYGSWMDSPMFEDFDFEEYVHNADYAANAMTYSGISKTNFLSIYPLGIQNEQYYIPNFFVDDDKYIADRNAISSENGTVLGAQYYSLIRNAGRLILTITDKNTGEKYFENVTKDQYAEFYYASQGRWMETLAAQDLNWAGTDADGKPLADGTEVEISLQAIPSYYNDVEDVSTLNAPGMFIKTPMTIDNTAPVVTDAVKTEDGKYAITAYDNRYTASVVVIGSDKKTVLGKYAVNQEEADTDMEILIDAPEDVFYVEVYDYALNGSVYRFNNTGHADTKFVTDITVDKDEVELEVGKQTQVKATVGPKWLVENYDLVEWTSDDESIAKVSANGVITAVAEGETVVKVTTLATDKKGKHLTAEVKVKVVKKAEKKSDEKAEEEKTETTDDQDKEEAEDVVEDTTEEATEEKASDETPSEDDTASEEETTGGEESDE